LIDSMKPLLDSEWEKLEAGINREGRTGEEPPEPYWMYSICPAVPSDWPPSPELFLIYYVYALGHAPRSLADGVYVAAPWASIEADTKRKRDLKFNRLSTKIREIGIQGERPLSRKETVVYNKKESVEAFLGNLTSMPDKTKMGVKELKEYYGTWFKLNDVIAEEIRAHHHEFFNWLGY
jgi:hypothetical protein